MSDFNKRTEKFYSAIIQLLKVNNFPFLIGGGVAVKQYAPDIGRPMKDLDIFCKAGDIPKILASLEEKKYGVESIDARWLAKVVKNGDNADLIYSSYNNINPVDDSWFTHATKAKLFGIDVKYIAPEELVWCKAYIQERHHFDGADVNHIILHQGKTFDWKRLLNHMENHWELLLSILLNFRFVYPSERGLIPKSLMEELIMRLQYQLNNPIPKDKVCRGPLLSRSDYKVDIEEDNFQTVV